MTYTFNATVTWTSLASVLGVVENVEPPSPTPPAMIPVSTVPKAVAYLYNAVKAQIALDPNPTNIYLCIGDPGIPDPPDIIEVCSSVARNWEHFTFVGSGGA